MPKQPKQDSRGRIWRDALARLAAKGGAFTVADAVEDLGMQYPHTSQLLRRLRQWGHLKLSGNSEPRRMEGRHAGGRPGHVYEVTDHGMKYLEWLRAQKKKGK